MQNDPNGANGEAMPGETLLSIEEMAATNFEAWDKSTKNENMIGRKEWDAFTKQWLPIIHLSCATMYMTKDELVKAFGENPEMFMTLSDDTETLGEKLKDLRQIVEGAHARLIVSGAAASLVRPNTDAASTAAA